MSSSNRLSAVLSAHGLSARDLEDMTEKELRKLFPPTKYVGIRQHVVWRTTQGPSGATINQFLKRKDTWLSELLPEWSADVVNRDGEVLQDFRYAGYRDAERAQKVWGGVPVKISDAQRMGLLDSVFFQMESSDADSLSSDDGAEDIFRMEVSPAFEQEFERGFGL